MKKELVFRAIKNIKAGHYVSLMKTRDLGRGITKVSSGMVVRLGVDYSKMKGTPAKDEVGSLPWGHWLPGYEGYVIEHEPKSVKEKREAEGDEEPKYEYYLRVAITGNKKHRGKVSYVDQDGNEIPYEEVTKIVAPSKLKFDDTPVYTVKFDDIMMLEQHNHNKRKKK